MANQGRSRGRPSKLTDETKDIILRLIRAGNYIETAAAAAGIHKDTFYQWLKHGARAKSGKYRRFRDEVLTALAESEILDLNTIRLASTHTWQAAAWRLERRFPQRWRARSSFQMELPEETAQEQDELATVLAEYSDAFEDFDVDTSSEEAES